MSQTARGNTETPLSLSLILSHASESNSKSKKKQSIKTLNIILSTLKDKCSEFLSLTYNNKYNNFQKILNNNSINNNHYNITEKLSNCLTNINKILINNNLEIQNNFLNEITMDGINALVFNMLNYKNQHLRKLCLSIIINALYKNEKNQLKYCSQFCITPIGNVICLNWLPIILKNFFNNKINNKIDESILQHIKKSTKNAYETGLKYWFWPYNEKYNNENLPDPQKYIIGFYVCNKTNSSSKTINKIQIKKDINSNEDLLFNKNSLRYYNYIKKEQNDDKNIKNLGIMDEYLELINYLEEDIINKPKEYQFKTISIKDTKQSDTELNFLNPIQSPLSSYIGKNIDFNTNLRPKKKEKGKNYSIEPNMNNSSNIINNTTTNLSTGVNTIINTEEGLMTESSSKVYNNRLSEKKKNKIISKRNMGKNIYNYTFSSQNSDMVSNNLGNTFGGKTFKNNKEKIKINLNLINPISLENSINSNNLSYRSNKNHKSKSIETKNADIIILNAELNNKRNKKKANKLINLNNYYVANATGGLLLKSNYNNKHNNSIINKSALVSYCNTPSCISERGNNESKERNKSINISGNDIFYKIQNTII